MKVSREGRQLARQLLRASLSDGRVDGAKVSAVVKQVAESKPRHYMGALDEFHRLLRLELAKRRALVESAEALDAATQASISNQLRERHGSDLALEFRHEPALIGGMRIRIGSDIWDGSVQGRLDRLMVLANRAA